MTGIATAIYENQTAPAVAGETLRDPSHMVTQMAGSTGLDGT